MSCLFSLILPCGVRLVSLWIQWGMSHQPEEGKDVATNAAALLLMRTGRNGEWRRERLMNVIDVFPKVDACVYVCVASQMDATEDSPVTMYLDVEMNR